MRDCISVGGMPVIKYLSCACPVGNGWKVKEIIELGINIQSNTVTIVNRVSFKVAQTVYYW